MNNVTPEKKEGMIKTLAVLGLLAIIILIAWLAVQIVKVFPNAVTSLASLADSVHNYDPNKSEETPLLEIDVPAQPANSGAVTVISWSPLNSGTYTFSYECAEGLSVDLKTTVSQFTNADCGKTFDLGNVSSVDLVINSEKQFETNFFYTISYYKKNELNPSLVVKESLPVINSRLATTTPGVEDSVTGPETATTTPVTTPAKPKPTVGSPTYQYQYSYVLPVSNPNGYTDLAITYLGVGRTDNYGRFINTGTLTRNIEGAIQFSIKNIGTKTSGDWSFKAKLPGNTNYESPKQLALKPNERTTVTVAFGAISDRGTENFSVEVLTNSDSNQRNNSFDWSATVK
ncbi:MAG TPA: hypothetical protein PKD95_03290 [Candidatus Paceibacterota bacterium]|nr:hypothetical protein [Candidatus Paceibacterota bacterium]